MTAPISEPIKVLVIDACGETAGVAITDGTKVLAREDLPSTGSAEIISVVGRVLGQVGWTLKNLDAIGVVNGPGSFTGVRVGLAAAKGLCEASSVRMIAVSRLQVLASAVGLTGELLAIDAGRSEFYISSMNAEGFREEWLGNVDELLAAAKDRKIIVTEARAAERLKGASPSMYSLHVDDVLKPVMRLYHSRSDDMTLCEANYLRRESDMYKKQGSGSAARLEE